MSKQYKNSYRAYSAWNYRKEMEDLDRASEQGWQLVKGGCFHSRFVKNPDIRYRYQLDFGRIEDMGRYIETFREQGWEYVNSTFNGWHYFRKLYDPALPEEAYEIFTDRESIQEMNRKWARIALIIGVILGLFALLWAIRVIREPQLPALVQLLTFVVESVVLLRGSALMRDPEASRNRRGDGAFLAVFLAVIILGAAASGILQYLRPSFVTEQQADMVDEPIVDNRWMSFDVKYPDNYYLDLTLEGETPVTFAIVDSAGRTVYTETGTDVHEKDIRVQLPRGEYWFSMSCDGGFHVVCCLE